MQLYGIRGENSWNKNRIPVTGDYGCWKKKSTRKQTFFVCLFVCFGFLDALWILCTSEFWKIPRRMYFSYGHTKCKLDLLVGSATAHKSNWGRRHLVGPYPQNTCSKEVAQNHEKCSSFSLSHQRGRTCLFRSERGYETRSWLAEDFWQISMIAPRIRSGNPCCWTASCNLTEFQKSCISSHELLIA